MLRSVDTRLTKDANDVNKILLSRRHHIAQRLILLFLGWALAASATAATPAFWQISHGQQHSYLLGSIHMGSPDWYPLPGAIEAAFDNSTHLVVEVDVRDRQAVARQIQALALLPPGQQLQQQLSQATWQRLKDYTAKLGIDARQLQPLRPWLAYMTLATLPLKQLGLEEQSGVDNYFLQRLGQRQLLSLETLEQQLSLFTSLSPRLQEQLLEMLMETPMTEANRLVNSWRTGNTEDLIAMITPDPDDDSAASRWFTEQMLKKRNQHMATRLQSLLSVPEQHFIIIGLAHLVGPDSVIDHLRRAGYQVRRIELPSPQQLPIPTHKAR